MDLSDLHPSRRAFVRAILVAGGCAPVLLGALRAAGANSKVPVVPGVQELSGDVRINRRPAQVGQVVHPGDVVRTGADGSCVIIIGAHVYLIREDAEIGFYEEDFAQDENGAVSGLVRIAKGAMLSVFGKTETQIATPWATIGIRGTACYVDSRADSTYACVCYGTADLGGAPDGRFLETVVTKHHDSPRLIYPPDAPERIVPAAVVDHTDAELKMLEAMVNREPPFVGKAGLKPYR